MAQHTMVAEAPAIQARQLGNRAGIKKGCFCTLRFQKAGGGGGQEAGDTGKQPYFSCESPTILFSPPGFLTIHSPLYSSTTGHFRSIRRWRWCYGEKDSFGRKLCMCVHLLVGYTLPRGEALLNSRCREQACHEGQLQLESLVTLS